MSGGAAEGDGGEHLPEVIVDSLFELRGVAADAEFGNAFEVELHVGGEDEVDDATSDDSEFLPKGKKKDDDEKENFGGATQQPSNRKERNKRQVVIQRWSLRSVRCTPPNQRVASWWRRGRVMKDGRHSDDWKWLEGEAHRLDESGRWCVSYRVHGCAEKVVCFVPMGVPGRLGTCGSGRGLQQHHSSSIAAAAM